MSDSVKKYYELVSEGKIVEANKIAKRIEDFIDELKSETKKSAENVLDEVMDNSPFRASFPLSKKYIISAMENYANYKVSEYQKWSKTNKK